MRERLFSEEGIDNLQGGLSVSPSVRVFERGNCCCFSGVGSPRGLMRRVRLAALLLALFLRSSRATPGLPRFASEKSEEKRAKRVAWA